MSPPTVTWLGHATVVVEIGGRRVITDPALTRRMAHLRRRRPLVAQAIEQLDLVVVSHVHMDHFHLPSLRLIDRSVPVVVPLGAAPLAAKAGFDDVHELGPDGQVTVAGVEVRAVPAVHRGGRGPHSRVASDAMGLVLSAGGRSVYFAGDTDYYEAMADLAGVDVALLPIWGWGPSIGDGHMDPSRAVAATELIRPGIVVPIHWGTYTPLRMSGLGAPSWLELPAVEFERRLGRTAVADRLRLLHPGQSS